MFIVFDHPTVHKNKNALGILYFHDMKKMVYATFNQNITTKESWGACKMFRRVFLPVIAFLFLLCHVRNL